MAVEDLVLTIPAELVGRVGTLITILEALGGFIILYLIFNVVNTIINRKRNKKIDKGILLIEEIRNLMVKQKVSKKK